jgi:prepilin-type processing-associated H-X9-DG protein
MLDAPEQRQVERYLEEDQAARERLLVLRKALAPLESDRDEIEPPADLAARTLAFIGGPAQALPQAPALGKRSGASVRAFWRRPDALVAASLLFLAMGMGITWVFHVRQVDALLACQNNLREFYGALKTFSEQHHNNFPNIAEPPLPKTRQVAGLFVPILASAGQLDGTMNLRCPGRGEGPVRAPVTLDKIQQMSEEQFALEAVMLACSYGYSLGYRDEAGNYRGPRFDSDQPNSQMPLMSDCPPLDPVLGNSPNHDGHGQNVLYVDGHVRYSKSRFAGVGGDDIFVNRAHQVGAGLDLLDTVIGRSGARP